MYKQIQEAKQEPKQEQTHLEYLQSVQQLLQRKINILEGKSPPEVYEDRQKVVFWHMQEGYIIGKNKDKYVVRTPDATFDVSPHYIFKIQGKADNKCIIS
jgi:hypothetical protein